MLFSIFQNNVVFDFDDAAATTFPLPPLVMVLIQKINLGQIWVSVHTKKDLRTQLLIPAH